MNASCVQYSRPFLRKARVFVSLYASGIEGKPERRGRRLGEGPTRSGRGSALGIQCELVIFI